MREGLAHAQWDEIGHTQVVNQHSGEIDLPTQKQSLQINQAMLTVDLNSEGLLDKRDSAFAANEEIFRSAA